MGLFSWFRGSPKPDSKPTQPVPSKAISSPSPSPETSVSAVPGMNGAVEVPRKPSPSPSSSPENVTVFEFGSLSASTDRVTLAGYCPVSEDLEPCRWLILPASEPDAPQFRVVF